MQSPWFLNLRGVLNVCHPPFLHWSLFVGGPTVGVGVGVGVPEANNSALAVTVNGLKEVAPPATNTLPEGSKLALCAPRGVVIFPVSVNVPATGSYSSAVSVS